MKVFRILFILVFALVFSETSVASSGFLRCEDLFLKINSASISEYYQIKKEIDPLAEFQSLDNKNLAGTYYSLVPSVEGYRVIRSASELKQKLGEIFKIPNGLEVGFGTGVRNILKNVFSHFVKEGYEVVLPQAEYPVYQHLADEVQIPWKTFTSHSNLSMPQNTNGKTVMVLTSPSSPLGRNLSLSEVAALQTWLRGNSKRRLVLDTVYTFGNRFDSSSEELLRHPQVLAVYSFAKAYLVPGHLGFAIGKANIYGNFLQNLNSVNYELASKAIAVAKAKPELPETLKNMFKERWEVLTPLVRKVLPKWQPPENGYLSVLPISAVELLNELGVWSFPLSTFGSKNPSMTVVSAIPPLRETLYHVTVLSNFGRAFNKYEMTYSKEAIPESTFPDKFFLLTESEIKTGLNKAKPTLAKTQPGDRLLVIQTSEQAANLFSNERTGKGRYVKSNQVPIEKLFFVDEAGKLSPISIEDAYADSLFLNKDKFVDINNIVPRSISILPIASACQASCKFCFSDFSISIEKRLKALTPEVIEKSMIRAKASGAERAVITGGGEPTIIGFPKLNEMIAISGKYFPNRVTLITNGLLIAKLTEPEILQRLLELDQSGLSVLAISRHHQDATKNAFIMGTDTKTEKILEVYAKNREKFKGLKLRVICVLQKTGVGTEKEIASYIEWARRNGVTEINFKELYVSTDRESKYAKSKENLYSEENRVYLRTVLAYAKQNGWKEIAKLPWGAPIFEKNIQGTRMQIAAYTEPSLFWERTHGVARSWNLMADGKLMMSLENGDTELSLDPTTP